MNNQGNLRVATFFTVLGIIANLAIIPYQIQLVGTDALKDVPVPIPVLYGILALQMGALVFIASILGLRMAARVGLSVSLLRAWLYEKQRLTFNKSWLWISLGGGAISALLLTLIDVYVFFPLIPQLAKSEPASWWSGLLTALYGGIVEEVLVRLFFTTLFVWLLARLFRKEKGNIPSWFYWFGIVLAALIFGAGHLPATIQAFGELTPALLVRGLLINSLAGMFFGYLYWKKGLEYAIIAHATADIFLHSIFPGLAVWLL